MNFKYLILFVFIPWTFCTLSFGVEPDEILLDPVLEKRARDISSELRCLVCRNENIDSSDAGLARDLRVLVRERLIIGDSNEEVINYVNARYGDFVLLKPKFAGSALILWFLGPVLFLIGVLLIYLKLFREKNFESRKHLGVPLSQKEQKEIDKILEN